jgi:hypothetical protein
MDNSQTLVYFDWNIFAYYRNYVYKHDMRFAKQFCKLQSLIKSDRLLSYYSDAHIDDLIPLNNHTDYDCTEDLSIITEITKDVILNFDPIKVEFRFYNENPVKIYNHRIKNYNPIIDIRNIFELDDPFGILLNSILESTPFPIPENSLFKPDSNKTLKDAMKYFMDWNNETLLDSHKFRDRKKEFYKIDDTGTFSEINKELQNDITTKFEALYNKAINISGNLIKSRMDEILLIFLLLDQALYASDKAQKNMQVDSSHAVYASIPNSTYFVSNDKKLIKKTKIAYKNLNI